MTAAVRRALDALIFWGLVTGGVLSCSAGFAKPVCACSKSKAYVTAMKSDLRNLVSAQEEYFAAHGRYADDAALSDSLFRSSTGVTVSIEFADAHGWRARATHVAIRGSCTIEAISSGDSTSTPSDFGDPRCDIDWGRRTCGHNGLVNTSADFWLFAFTARRRQRRRWRREIEELREDFKHRISDAFAERRGELAAETAFHGIGLEPHTCGVECRAESEQLC